MNVINCRMCGRMFNSVSNERCCPNCAKRLEEKFQQVKEYIRENPKAPLEMISTDNDVSVKQLKSWVRQERLVFSDDSPVGLDCEKCGKLIRSGRFCDACKGSLADTFEGALDKPKPAVQPKKEEKDRNRMRFLKS